MNIEIITGDATMIQGYDALVVPANRQLSLGWGSHVAEKVRKCAGSSVEKEALSHYPRGMKCGEAVVTSAGDMQNFTWLIHAAVLDKYDFNPLFLLKLKMRTSPECLTRGVCASLHATRAAGIKSLVFTPMGSGIGGMADGMCAAIMIKEILQFRKKPGEICLKNVAIACFKEKTAAIFQHELEKSEYFSTHS
jgi:O-acetyl-ADP-ribose deacetylase (regulator of RNase III)